MPSSQLTIGVVVIAFNAENYLSDCLDSLLAQSYPPSKIIVCDDASADNTPNIISEYKNKHPDLIETVIHPENTGIASNVNSGIKLVTQDYISFIAGDDLWHKDKLKFEINALLSDKDKRWVYSDAGVIGENGEYIEPFRRKYDGSCGHVLYEVLTHEMSLRNYLAETALIKSVGLFDANLKIFEDWDFKIRLAQAAPVAHVNRETVYYRRHARGISQSPPPAYHESLVYIYKKHSELVNSLPDDQRKSLITMQGAYIAKVYERHCRFQLNNGNAAEALSNYFKMSRFNIRKIFELRLLARIILRLYKLDKAAKSIGKKLKVSESSPFKIFLIGIFRTMRKDVRYIFSINAGRSGSEYLATLFASSHGVHAYHEAAPYMTGRYLDLITRSDYPSSYTERRYKTYRILRKALLFKKNAVYAETNHMFIKTFFDAAVNDLSKLTAVHIRREFFDTLISFIRLGFFSDKGGDWADWMSSPNAATAAIPCIAEDSELDQIDLCIAYLLDIEARAQRFKKDYPDIKVIEVHLEDLNDLESVRSLFQSLGLEFTAETEKVIGRKVNERNSRKSELKIKTDRGQLKQRFDQYVKRAEEKGIKIPETLYIK